MPAGGAPAILSRGYGREIADPGVTVVSDGRDGLSDLAHSGDEPLMLARAVAGAAVLVCEDRALAGTLAETALGCTVHILDDGFQHHRLRRDVDIVLVAPEDFSAKVMPLGRLREPLDALDDADAILVDRGDVTTLTHSRHASFVGGLKRRLLLPASVAAGARVFAVAGIASPERFFDSLTSAGYIVAGSIGFADHHRFATADARRIAAAAASSGATAIVTTSKDVMKLEPLGPWPVPLVEVPLEVSVEPGDAFRAWLVAAVASAHADGTGRLPG